MAVRKDFALVTGGTKGIGLGLSGRLVSLGYQVVALYRGDKESAAAAEREFGDGLRALRVDLADSGAVTAVADELLTVYGAPKVLVNNAGRNIDRPFLDMSFDDWNRVIAANLSAPFYLTRALAPAMLAAGGGSVVNVAATTGIRPRLNGINYCASKAGLLHFTKCLAMELAPTIRVNSLIPGMIDTEEMRTRFRTDEPYYREKLLEEIPQGRIGDVDMMADALEFLISEKASYITGQKLIVDGGQFMW
jgi:acetoacetyl-CoA reductase/3-oxoacyl-[acyl-carrier protein] reductase